MVKNLPEMQETQVRSLGGEDPLEKGIATHSSILPGKFHVQKGAWWAIVFGVAKSQTQMRDLTLFNQKPTEKTLQLPAS